MRPLPIVLGVGAAAAALFLVLVPDWTHPPIPAEQFPPGPSMVQFHRGQMPIPVSQEPPAPLPPAAPGGPAATAVYHNVQVLTDVSAAEFMRLQQAMTHWVSPEEGCGFCHAGTDYASDANPRKNAARAMLRMVRHVNTDWTSHVRDAGVTCYTCHRGQPVPADVWFPRVPRPPSGHVAEQENWHEAADSVRKFFPDAAWDLYLLTNMPLSVQSATALPGRTVSTQIVAKRVYEMMMQMSDGIGVNCGYCHNSRALFDWQQSTPQRWTGQSGIDLTRDLDQNFLPQVHAFLEQTRERVVDTTLPVLPARETGPQPANGFVLCATCHMARPRPLNGAAMAADYPGLRPAAAQQGASR